MPKTLAVNDHVRLTHDVPKQSLQRGQVGVVCSTWFAPDVTYEVEFESGEQFGRVRAMVGEWEVQLDKPRNAGHQD